MKHEGDPLARAEPSQHLQQRGADLIVEGGPVGRLEVGGGGDVERTGLVGLFVAGACRAHLVEAETSGDDGQPGAEVVDLRDVRARQPQERLLRDVLGAADVAEHLVGEIHQVGAMTAPCGVDRR